MPGKRKLKQALGKVVVGDQFWDRDSDLKLFVEMIEARSNVLLVAQRRMGKTSLMAEADRVLRGRYACLFVDMQKAKDGADAVAEIGAATKRYPAVWKKVAKIFRNVLGRLAGAVEEIGLWDLRVKLRAGLTAGDWTEKGDQLFQVLAQADPPVVLLLDEVPILVNRMLKGQDFAITPERRAAADEFMSWLRQNSIGHQGKVSIVLSGSIGLEPVLRQAGLSASINNFAPFELAPWDQDAAIGCIRALAGEYGIELGERTAEAMVRRLGCCIPHHVQMFFDQVKLWCRRTGATICPASRIPQIYRTGMLSARGHAELTHYEERLEMVLGMALFPLAVDMLTEAAVTGWLTAEAIQAFQREYALSQGPVREAQKEILWVLEHDGYLERGGKGLRFVSKLLRDWWKNRHSIFYVPILDRGV